ncbi:endo-1,3(4)-beta-glucanase [Sporothrix schenckii 1099-18]|uniref:GH16 domain-containing protein n=2 Tax=Sporothrix schenckii TaxID=29908 RepID=U7Q531_SPOS1|nr:endo-1,3(4)-beta-glucanase [Sporothrix schenckii 1099-18]ERT02918.1 hypothetical protein HMPREF1624_01222 [Sporothrix schenckii ATCC 58251]KJR84723.1 endo-1,3(4)-beta-glucanase [Sporothrix schenckii 1099-18]
MYTASLLAAAAVLPNLLVSATAPPSYPGFTLIWNDTFAGAAGTPPNANNWRTVTGYLNQNSEAEVYSSSTKNLQLSGSGSLQIVPLKDPQSSGPGSGWTSGRVESVGGWLPAAGQKTRVEGRIRMGDGPAGTKQGIWPAFWLLGEAIRTGTNWPQCGELDILELRNGVATGFGTAHCGTTANGGVCNEPSGRGATVAVPDPAAFHTWTMTWDRTSSDYKAQTIQWALDQTVYFTLAGVQLDEATWRTLAASGFYIVMNVAVGGDFPGAPNSATQGGAASQMEVQYVAVYATN